MKKNKILIFIVFVLIAGYLVYSYVYKSHRDIASEEGSFAVSANALHSEFKTNEQQANLKYLDRTISVHGKISNIDLEANTIIIDDKMVAVFKDEIPLNLKVHSDVNIKGRFIGYDDLLGELKMDQCGIETK